MRQTVIAVADNRLVTKFFTGSKLAPGLVDRFVAGETIDQRSRRVTISPRKA